MLTDNYLQRSPSKWKPAVIIILSATVVAAVISFEVNLWLPRFALSFASVISQQIHARIDFTSVHYRFPGKLVFQGVRVLSLEEKLPLLQTSSLTLGFSFPLFSSSMPLRQTDINGLEADMPTLKKYLVRHGREVAAYVKKFPPADFRLLIDGRLFVFGFGHPKTIGFNMDCTLDQKRLAASGAWGNNERSYYQVNGRWQDGGLELDKFTVKDKSTSVNLWGRWRGAHADWKGFMFYKKFYILDIDGHLRMEPEAIVLKGLSFSIDGDSVEAWGRCSREDLFQCRADVTYSRTTPHISVQQPLKNLKAHLHMENTPQGAVFGGWSDLHFMSQKAHIDVDHASAMMMNDNSLRFRINRLRGLFSIHGQDYNLPLEQVLLGFTFETPYRKTITLSGRLFSGRGYSRIFLDTSDVPWQLQGEGKFEGVNMARGTLAGNFDWQSSKDMKLRGSLALRHGQFSGTPFQAWLAKTLQMPSLEQVSGADFSCRFRIDGKSRTLDDLNLESEDIHLRGSFHLDADDLVSSLGAVQFSKKLLSESPIGLRIMGLVEGAWTLPIEFRLSGNIERVNFQWNNSPLKDKVHQHLFSFFEREIDRRMDAHPYYNVTMPNESVTPG